MKKILTAEQHERRYWAWTLVIASILMVGLSIFWGTYPQMTNKAYTSQFHFSDEVELRLSRGWDALVVPGLYVLACLGFWAFRRKSWLEASGMLLGITALGAAIIAMVDGAAVGVGLMAIFAVGVLIIGTFAQIILGICRQKKAYCRQR